jgi:nucleotide-binding universal stress UspA family protein
MRQRIALEAEKKGLNAMALSILLPTDGSPSALHAAHWINEHAAADVSVTLLQVMVVSVEKAIKDGLKDAREESQKILVKTQAELPRLTSVHTESIVGIPAETIVHYIQNHPIDLIVMGRRGHSAIGNLIGSVSFSVLQRAPIPVTFVEPGEV